MSFGDLALGSSALTSRNASSIDSGSTSGAICSSTSKTALLAST